MASTLNPPTPRESQLLSLIRQHGPLSRKELHERTGLRPNTVGEIVADMLNSGMLREGESESVGVGRPRQLLEIDGSRLHVIGIAFEHGRVSSCRLNLRGQRVGNVQERSVDLPDDLVAAASEMVRDLSNEQTLGVGLSTTGFVDPYSRSILTSSATMSETPTRLEAVYAAAADHPFVVENDMHARATYWLLNQDLGRGDAITRQDILLIDLSDGAIGSALLVGGRPNRGCIIGGNELGHTRFPVETEVCFCGHTGCLERIFSSAFLQRIGQGDGSDLSDRIANYTPADEGLQKIAGHLSMGIANVINFVRPDRVVLAGRILSGMPFCNDVIARVRNLLLRPLADRVRIDLWEKPALNPSEAAAWLALGDVFRGGHPEELIIQLEETEGGKKRVRAEITNHEPG